MDRRAFLTTILQGSLAAALLPNSLSPLLIAQYGSLIYFGQNYQQKIRIAAVGIGTFGAYCTRLLAYSVHTITCYEVSSGVQSATTPDITVLNNAIQQTDLLFLLTDLTEPLSAPMLTACCHAASAGGIQTVVVGLGTPDFQTHVPAACSSLPYPPHITVADPSTARQLVAMVADLVNTDSFVGIDHGDVKAILRSGSHAVFACREAAGTERGKLASIQALEELQHRGIDRVKCRGAMACIYGSSTMAFDDYVQASAVLDEYFSDDISFVFGSVVDERLGDVIKVAILAMKQEGELHGSY
jgi:hypothetical protein